MARDALRAWALAVFLAGAPAQAMNQPPHLDEAGAAAYRQYQAAASHRAFAIAPGGRYGWSADAGSPDLASAQALAYCQEGEAQRCVPYSVDGRTVFDARAWPGLWAPYLGARDAARAPVGLQRGMRFPDLALLDARQRSLRLSDLRGRVTVLHFWGSWCGACRTEMPDMQAAARKLGRSVQFVLVPVREPLDRARAWLRSQGIDLPLYDGAGDAGEFRLASGARLRDRDLAKAFPTTYILDRHGIVLFSRTGPLPHWLEYVVLLQHASRSSPD